jgi:hypothetical protein|nr:MAG TPA: Head decoration protein, Viral protein.95A [Caudoviricetes sp.]DAM73738.1 MAG TPA: Head decoration protein, Viral protein.95A [Caudoviricetes sp.]DAQ60253.1 MAG TPA: Head decoration protein, Viral protein.95A [Caudoviricetes sp.]DAV73131.1 MAG TPA: Head decoration protein, Viral protein.95A [Caudoviricetes sp.]
MKFTRNTVNGINDTILASNDYTAIPFTVTETAAVKAGYPMTKAGKKATSATADGILLYDVDPAENPNASLLIRGVIDTKKAAASSGFTYDTDAIAALKTAIPGIFCRDNISVNA